MSTFSNAVILDNGMIYIFKKPTIEKDFCFGFYNGDDYNEAQDMAEYAKNDGGAYFIRKNLEQFDNFEDCLKDMGEGRIFATLSYYAKSNICDITDYLYGHEKQYTLTKEDIENLIEVNKSEKIKFEKRLNTYLKKYGTSKLRTWTYWKEA